MRKKIPIGYMEWKDTTSAELGYVTTSEKNDYRYRAPDGQAFNLYSVDSRRSDSDPTIITSTSYDYRIDDLLRRKMDILAHHANSRVIVSEVPGITMDQADPFHTQGAFMTPIQKFGSVVGNFDFLAQTQLEAIEAEIGLEHGQEVQLFGESLGAYMVTCMARVLSQRCFEKQLSVSRLDLFEPVNASGNRTLLSQGLMLANLVNIEEPLRQGQYFDENTEIGHGDVRAFEKMSDKNAQIDKFVKGQQMTNALLSGSALRKGLHRAIIDGLEDKTSDGVRLHEADITFWRTTNSTVSREARVNRAVEVVSRAGGRVRQIELIAGEGDMTRTVSHHALASLGRQASFALAYANKS